MSRVFALLERGIPVRDARSWSLWSLNLKISRSDGMEYEPTSPTCGVHVHVGTRLQNPVSLVLEIGRTACRYEQSYTHPVSPISHRIHPSTSISRREQQSKVLYSIQSSPTHSLTRRITSNRTAIKVPCGREQKKNQKTNTTITAIKIVLKIKSGTSRKINSKQ